MTPVTERWILDPRQVRFWCRVLQSIGRSAGATVCQQSKPRQLGGQDTDNDGARMGGQATAHSPFSA
jgi:hypothetical protein